MIANTDRHYDNISLLLANDHWTLSLTYDMLPMLHAPMGGELVQHDFGASPLQPTAATLPEWPQARALATQFWQAAASDTRCVGGLSGHYGRQFKPYRPLASVLITLGLSI